jgi:hypothetical protein
MLSNMEQSPVDGAVVKSSPPIREVLGSTLPGNRTLQPFCFFIHPHTDLGVFILRNELPVHFSNSSIYFPLI